MPQQQYKVIAQNNRPTIRLIRTEKASFHEYKGPGSYLLGPYTIDISEDENMLSLRLPSRTVSINKDLISITYQQNTLHFLFKNILIFYHAEFPFTTELEFKHKQALPDIHYLQIKSKKDALDFIKHYNPARYYLNASKIGLFDDHANQLTKLGEFELARLTLEHAVHLANLPKVRFEVGLELRYQLQLTYVALLKITDNANYTFERSRFQSRFGNEGNFSELIRDEEYFVKRLREHITH